MSERAHPYDLVFGLPEFETERFPAIGGDAETHGVDVYDREAFLLLASVGELLRALLPPDSTGTAFEQFGPIVAQAFQYWLNGKQTFTLEEAKLRELLGSAAAIGAWDMAPPTPAGYVQLPRNVLFARIDESAHAEAVDGFFFTMPGLNDPAVPPYSHLDVLLVLGLVPHRGGFSVIAVTAPITAEAPGHFGDAQARAAGADFTNVLPGGERLFAVTNTLEVLKLVARCFRALS